MTYLGAMPSTDGRPEWRRVADELREQIRSGLLQPGDVLPSEAQLEQQTGLSRTTIRRVVAELRAGGWVATRRTGSTVLGNLVVALAPGDEATVNEAGALVVRRADGSVGLYGLGTKVLCEQRPLKSAN